MDTTSATKTLQGIVDAFVSYVNSSGIRWSDWYVGIAANPRSRLFVEHNVQEHGGRWIYEDAGSEQGARTVEKFLIETYGTKGDTGGGDSTTTYVYAYAITPTTRE